MPRPPPPVLQQLRVKPSCEIPLVVIPGTMVQPTGRTSVRGYLATPDLHLQVGSLTGLQPRLQCRRSPVWRLGSGSSKDSSSSGQPLPHGHGASTLDDQPKSPTGKLSPLSIPSTASTTVGKGMKLARVRSLAGPADTLARGRLVDVLHLDVPLPSLATCSSHLGYSFRPRLIISHIGAKVAPSSWLHQCGPSNRHVLNVKSPDKVSSGLDGLEHRSPLPPPRRLFPPVRPLRPG